MRHGIAILLAALLAAAPQAFAQRVVTGVVKDNKGEAVIGAVVMLKGSSTVAAMTAIDGSYTLNVPDKAKAAVLVASSLGYKTAEQEYKGQKTLDFILEEEMDQLSESVVVGYGSMRKSDLTGSVASIRIDETKAAQSTSLDQLLQGKAAGVQVVSGNNSPDGGVSIRVRGLGSFNGNCEPLYVVDGIILNSTGGVESVLTVGSENEDTDEAVNGLMGLNPQDIASIEILKDASATAIYGALGANGVVLITTKNANKDIPVISFSAGVDVNSLYKKIDVLGFDDYFTLLELQKQAGIATGSLMSKIYDDPASRTGLKVTPVDWQDYCFRTALSQRYHLSISGAPKSVSYSFSVGYSDKNGIVRNTGVKNLSMRLNLEKRFGKSLTIGTKSNIGYVSSRAGQSSGKAVAATSLIRSILSYRPYMSAVDDDEEVEDAESKAGPDRWLKDFVNTRKEVRITPSFYVQYKFLDGFSFKSAFGADFRDSDRTKFKSSQINSTAEGSTGALANYRYLNWNWDNTLQYKLSKGAHNLNLMVGSAAYSSLTAIQNVQGWNIEQYRGLEESICTAPNARQSYDEKQYSTLSFFTRAVYNLKDRYVLTATYRMDGSSKFQGANKWSSFPSFAFAWRLSEEPWFNVPAISKAKFRLGWGRVGNQAITSYQTLSNYGNSTYSNHFPGNDAGYTVGIVPLNIANPDLKWETTEQTNAGIDLDLWHGRVALTVDAYDKKTRDLLQTKNIATSSGFSTMWVNEGTIQNRGIEFTLDTTPLKTSLMEWGLSGNISFNRGKILSISDSAAKGSIWLDRDHQIEAVYFTGSSVGSSNYASAPLGIFMVGYPLGLFYGYKTEGIVQTGETGPALVQGGEPAQPGHLKFVDTNGNGYIDDNDRMIVGDPNPKFTYGFSSSLSVGIFTLKASFSGSYGNSIININNMRETDSGQKNHNLLKSALYDAWTPENPDARYWAVGCITTTETRFVKDIDIEDGSYLRCDNISLSCDLPVKSKVINGLNIGLSANNLVVFTRYSGWNPDVNSFGSNIMKMGADAGTYPSSRSFCFDVKLSF